MLYREIMAVCSQIHTKHINTLCGQNVVLLNVKLAVHAGNSLKMSFNFTIPNFVMCFSVPINQEYHQSTLINRSNTHEPPLPQKTNPTKAERHFDRNSRLSSDRSVAINFFKKFSGLILGHTCLSPHSQKPNIIVSQQFASPPSTVTFYCDVTEYSPFQTSGHFAGRDYSLCV